MLKQFNNGYIIDEGMGHIQRIEEGMIIDSINLGYRSLISFVNLFPVEVRVHEEDEDGDVVERYGWVIPDNLKLKIPVRYTHVDHFNECLKDINLYPRIQCIKEEV